MSTISPARKRGFTLFEMLVVVTVLALVMALVPRVSPRLGEPAVTRTADAVETQLRRARDRAILTGRAQRLLIDLDARAFAIEELAGRDGWESLPRGIELALVSAAEESPRQGIGAIAFFADGSSSGGRLDLADEEEGGVVIDIAWLTGRIETRLADATR